MTTLPMLTIQEKLEYQHQRIEIFQKIFEAKIDKLIKKLG